MGKFTEMYKGINSPGTWVNPTVRGESLMRMFEEADMEIARYREEVERLRKSVADKHHEVQTWAESAHQQRLLAEASDREIKRLEKDLGLCKKERDAARLERDIAFKELDIAHKELESYRGSFEGKAHDLRQSMADMVGAIRKALVIPMGPPPTVTEVPLTISQLVKQAHDNAVDKGWYEGETVNFGERLMLIVSEVSEALEDYRNRKGVNEVWYESKEGSKFLSNDAYKSRKPCGIPSELADAVIRIADLCGHYGISLEAAIIDKMAYNKSRPHRHGGKKA